MWTVLTLGLSLADAPNARGASAALIVAGLSGTSANTEEFQRLSGETKRLLAERGIPLENVQTLGGKVTRETILQKLSAAAANCSAEDEFWLVLYGHGGRSQGGAPAFQVTGPRLTALDLKAALEAIPARQFVFIGTSDSGAFLPVLQSPRRAALSATRAEGEDGQPRLSRCLGQRVRRKSEEPLSPPSRHGRRRWSSRNMFPPVSPRPSTPGWPTPPPVRSSKRPSA